MNTGRTILSQLLDFVSKYEFDKCVEKYKGNYRVQSFTCWEQFIVMAFAQITHRESLRDIESCLGAVASKLYHSGVKSKVKKSTLSDANESRDWRIYAEFAQLLIQEARSLYKEDNSFSVDIDEIAYALDSSTIDLCLSLFPWAKFRKNKGAVKMHTQIDLRGSIPTFIEITDGKVHDVNILDLLILEPGAFYIMDRAYLDFERLFPTGLGCEVDDLGDGRSGQMNLHIPEFSGSLSDFVMDNAGTVQGDIEKISRLDQLCCCFGCDGLLFVFL